MPLKAQWATMPRRRRDKIVEAKSVLKEILPPFLIRWTNRYVERRYGFHGDYPDWQTALAASDGYGTREILGRVKKAALRVKNGEAVFEQDSVLHYRPDYHWPVLAGLSRIAALRKNRLTVLDYGGSLGSSYFQNKPFLSSLTALKWLIVEQKAFVQFGNQQLRDEKLRFFSNIRDCTLEETPDVVLLSSVLPYLEKPYKTLEEIDALNIPHMIIDRHPLLARGNRDRLTVQRVRPSIYKASYPVWFFCENKFRNFIEPRWHIIATFDTPMQSVLPAKFKGFILEKRV